MPVRARPGVPNKGKKMNGYYRLPNGKTTRDTDEYRNAWSDLGDRLCRALGPGWKLNGCDPGISIFRIQPNGSWRTARFDVDIAERIISLHEMSQK